MMKPFLYSIVACLTLSSSALLASPMAHFQCDGCGGAQKKDDSKKTSDLSFQCGGCGGAEKKDDSKKS